MNAVTGPPLMLPIVRGSGRSRHMPSAPPARLVVIRAAKEPLPELVQALVDAGYEVVEAAGGLDGLVAVEEQHPALVVLPWSLPFIDAEIILYALRTGLSDPPPVLVLVEEGVDPGRVLRAGAQGVLPRSVDADTLLRAVRESLARV